MSRPRALVDLSISIEEMERVRERTGSWPDLHPVPVPDPVDYRFITIEDQEQLRDVPQLVRSAKENRRRRYTHAVHFEDDRAGRPCICGTTPDELCALHARLVGHRRHVRPG
jgi:hypothetical protein